jgi:hypothetical protein
MFNYSVTGITAPPGVFHTVRLKHKAAPGQTLTYKESGKIYRVLHSEQARSGSFGEVRVVEVGKIELTDDDRDFLRQCGISWDDLM